jgi:hypothetical protein
LNALTDMDLMMRGGAEISRRGGDICRLIAVIFVIASALTGCATDSLFGSKSTPTATTTTPTSSTATSSAPASSSSGSFGDQFNDFFRGKPTKTAADDPPGPIDCPNVEVREGAATYAVNASDDDQSALTLRYQATFGEKARECHVNAGILTIKVGVRGRVILGPAGVPGNVTVPLRYALVQEGVEPKTIWTRFYAVPVNVSPGETNVQFSHVMQDIAVPVPKSSDLDAYVVYIGFDPNGLEQPKPKAKPKKARTSSASQLSTH